jgi:hypothetical protein
MFLMMFPIDSLYIIFFALCIVAYYKHSYDILGAGMLWKLKDLHKIR